MEDNTQPVAIVSKLKKPSIGQFFSTFYSGLTPKEKKRKTTKLLIVILIFVSVGGLIWQGYKNNSRLEAMSYAVEGLSPTQKAQYYSDMGEYKIAEKIWQDELAKTTDTPTKLNIYYMQSAIAVKFKNYKDAKIYADKALKLAPKSNITYVALARLAQAQGDKVSAKKYWQQAIKFIDPKNPAINLIQEDYQASLDALK